MSAEYEFADIVEECVGMPRSERVEFLFNFEPTDYQAELLDHHENQAKTQAAPKKGRQVGASLVGSALAADYALWNPGEDVLITAPMQDPADELFDKFTEHFKRSDFTLGQLGVVEDNKTEWTFSHGARVLARTLGQGKLSQRSKNPSFVIVDEAAYADDYHLSEVIEPFFITHPEYEFYLFSTPLGKSGYFYDAVEGKNSERWFSPHWPTEISPFADEDFLQRKREEKDSQSFAQEYLGEFVASEDTFRQLTDYADSNPRCKVLNPLGYERYGEFFESHALPQVDNDPKQRESVIESFTQLAKSEVGDYKYVTKGCEKIFGDLETTPTGYVLKSDLDAFEAFVDDQVSNLNEYRQDRFPVAYRDDGPTWDRVDHRDLILTDR